jgi:hypothetical protein
MRKSSSRTVLLVERAARVAFTFVLMNCAAVQGLVAAAFRRKVWRG